MLEHSHTPEAIAARLAVSQKSSHLRDFVYGGIDGAVTTFAIVAGVAGAGLSSTIIIALGIANVLADGFSMAAGNYTGSKAEAENIERLRAIEQRHIREVPEGEREELRQILAARGLSGDVLEGAVAAISRNESVWIEMMLAEEYGVGGTDPDPMHAALATFFAFVLCGAVPLAPLVIGMEAPFAAAIVATACVFFAIGALKSRWSLRAWWWSGLETLAIGGVAASIAWGAGRLVGMMTGGVEA